MILFINFYCQVGATSENTSMIEVTVGQYDDCLEDGT